MTACSSLREIARGHPAFRPSCHRRWTLRRRDAHSCPWTQQTFVDEHRGSCCPRLHRSCRLRSEHRRGSTNEELDGCVQSREARSTQPSFPDFDQNHRARHGTARLGEGTVGVAEDQVSVRAEAAAPTRASPSVVRL